MAFSDMDKECLRNCHAYFVAEQAKRELTAQEAADLDTILVGDEADKITVAQWYAENVELPTLQGEIDGSSERSPNLGMWQTKKTDFDAYVA